MAKISKKLINKAIKALQNMEKIRQTAGAEDLQFISQRHEKKAMFYQSIDYMKMFIDNIDYKEQ